MKLGVSTSCYYPLETELALEQVCKSGFQATEVFFNAESELKPAFTDILKDIKDNYNTEIVSVHPTFSLAESFMIFSAYERRLYEALDKYARYSEIAAELGAKYIIMHGGKPNGILSDEEYCERYMMVKNATLKNGVTVLQENVTAHRAGSVEFMRSMKNILGDEAEFCIDIKQAIRSGYEPISLVKEFIENTKHYHLSDHSTASDCLLPLKNGCFDFQGFFDLLNNHSYNGACIVEVYSNAYSDYAEIIDSYKKLVKIL